MDRHDRADTVLRSLLRELACGRWPSGSRLPPVRQLETEFVTSRLTMLEVLHRAEAAGLLSVQPRQGATVRPAAAEQAARLLAVRRAASHGRRLAILIPDYFMPPAWVPYYSEFAQAVIEDAMAQDIAAEVVEIPILDQVAFAGEFATRGFFAAVVLGYVPSYLVCLHILKQQRFPVLLINREPRSLQLPWINQDEAGAIYAVIARLTAMGHRNICLVRRPLDLALLQRVTREKTWVRTLRRSGLFEECTFPLYYIPFGDVTLSMDGLLNHPRRPTALVFENGDLCERLLKCPRYRRLKIPRDLSLVTFDRIHDSGWVVDCPPVTTIEPDRHAMTSAILLRVNEMLNGNPEPENGHVPMMIRMTDSVASLGR